MHPACHSTPHCVCFVRVGGEGEVGNSTASEQQLLRDTRAGVSSRGAVQTLPVSVTDTKRQHPFNTE
jgi:ferredoxin